MMRVHVCRYTSCPDCPDDDDTPEQDCDGPDSEEFIPTQEDEWLAQQINALKEGDPA